MDSGVLKIFRPENAKSLRGFGPEDFIVANTSSCRGDVFVAFCGRLKQIRISLESNKKSTKMYPAAEIRQFCIDTPSYFDYNDPSLAR